MKIHIGICIKIRDFTFMRDLENQTHKQKQNLKYRNKCVVAGGVRGMCEIDQGD